jgi:integrase
MDWYIAYRIDGRRFKRRIGPNKKVAEQVLMDVEVKKAKGDYLGIHEVKKILFTDCLDEYLTWAQVNKAPNTFAMNRFYADRLREAFTGYLSALTAKQVENYKVKRRATVSPATVHQTKNNEPRVIPMNQTLYDELHQLPRGLHTPYVFCHENGERSDEVKRSFTSPCRKAGIMDFRFHDLRHTFASHLVMNGIYLKTVQHLLGHQDIRMTLRYAYLSGEHLQAAVGTLDAGLKMGTKREQGTSL